MTPVSCLATATVVVLTFGAPASIAQTPATGPAGPPAAAAPAPVDCSPRGNVQFVCIPNSEDIFYMPGTDWALLGTRGFRAINVRDRSVVPLYPSDTAKEVPAPKTYPDCSAVAGDERTRFGVHGISAIAGPKAGTFTVFGSHLGARSVDVFEVDVTGNVPTATWVGCVNSPEPIALNGVVPIPGGGFIGTNWLGRGEAGRGFRPQMEQGAISGELWEWHTATGWVKVPGSEGAGNNGVELSKDGKMIYVAEFGTKSFYRITRGVTPPTIDKLPLGFRPDNVHWTPDGMLLVTGNTNPDQAPLPPSTRVVKIDPNTLRVTELLNLPDTPEFRHATGAAQIGNEIWVSAALSARLAVFPVPR